MTTTNGDRILVRASDIVQDELQRVRSVTGRTWRAIAEMPEYSPIPAGTLATIAKTGYIPPKWYHHLGLPPKAILTEPCLKCGEVHTVPWCTKEAGIKPVKTNGRSQPHRTPPVRVGECSNEEWSAIRTLTPAERKKRLLGG